MIDEQVIHVQVIVKKNIVCDGPMRKKYKSTMLLMGGTDSPNTFALGSLFKLIFSYNKKEDAEGGIATRKQKVVEVLYFIGTHRRQQPWRIELKTRLA